MIYMSHVDLPSCDGVDIDTKTNENAFSGHGWWESLNRSGVLCQQLNLEFGYDTSTLHKFTRSLSRPTTFQRRTQVDLHLAMPTAYSLPTNVSPATVANTASLVRIVALSLISGAAIASRLFAVINFESIIHELCVLIML